MGGAADGKNIIGPFEDVELPFAELYHWSQTRFYALCKFVGPLHPFFSCSLMSSAMYLSSKRASETPQTPKQWNRCTQLIGLTVYCFSLKHWVLILAR